MHLVRNSKDAMVAISSLSDPIIQEYLPGDEFTCTVAIYNGIVSDVVCLQRELRAGDTFRAFPVKNVKIEEYVKAIAIRLKINGSCNFQLRLNGVGRPVLFEINSRFSGTTPFCALLGFNPVEFCLKHHLGMPYESDVDYSKVVVRHWCEVVVEKEQLGQLRASGHGAIDNVTLSSML